MADFAGARGVVIDVLSKSLLPHDGPEGRAGWRLTGADSLSERAASVGTLG
jgi:hypothetical protein